MLIIGIVLMAIVLAALVVISIFGLKIILDKDDRSSLQISLFFVFIIMLFGLGFSCLLGSFRRDTMNYYVNHQNEFVVDTVTVNGVLDHYEVKAK